MGFGHLNMKQFIISATKRLNDTGHQ